MKKNRDKKMFKDKGKASPDKESKVKDQVEDDEEEDDEEDSEDVAAAETEPSVFPKTIFVVADLPDDEESSDDQHALDEEGSVSLDIVKDISTLKPGTKAAQYRLVDEGEVKLKVTLE